MSETCCQIICKKICCCCLTIKKSLKTLRVSIDREKINYDDSVTLNTVIQNNNKDMNPNDINKPYNGKNIYLNNHLDKDIELLNNENSELKKQIHEFTLQSESVNNYGILHIELDKKVKTIEKLQEDIENLKEQLKEVVKKINQSNNASRLSKNPSDPLLSSGRFKKIQANSVSEEEKQQIDPELKKHIEILESNLKNEKEKANAFTTNNAKMSNDLKILHTKHIEKTENLNKTNELWINQQKKTQIYMEKLDSMTREIYMSDEIMGLIQEQKGLQRDLAEVSIQYEECLRENEKYKRGTNEDYYENVINELTQNLKTDYW